MKIGDLVLKKLNREFYERDTVIVARELLGKYLIHNIDGKAFVAKIIETEAYKENDKAAHFNGGKRTSRTEIAFGEGGHAYIYLIYGMYYCFNIVTEPNEIPGAVLIRTVEPICGLELMMENRNIKDKRKIKDLCNGPGKLCQAMQITKEQHGKDLLGDEIYIAEDKNIRINENEIKVSKRINIDYAEECKDYLWRFNI